MYVFCLRRTFPGCLVMILDSLVSLTPVGEEFYVCEFPVSC
jgi:hypothetical protein